MSVDKPVNTGALGRKPHDCYSDSRIEWLGRIPKHWKTCPLKYVTRFINGAAFKPEGWGDTGVPIIRIENLNGSEHFNYSLAQADPRYTVRQGDLLFAWSGNRGTSFGPFIWTRPGFYYLNQHIFRLTGFPFVLRWFYWTLKGVTAFVEKQAHGIIGMVHITGNDLGVIPIPLIPEREQRAIADFLDRETAKIDALIAKKQRLIELLEEKRDALISHAVTKGLDPNVPIKDSGIEWLGQVPRSWEMVRIGRKITLQRGVDITKDTQNDGNVPVVSSGGVSSFHDRALARGPGVVVGRKGTAGAVYYIERDFWPHDTTLWVREFRGSHPRYVFYKLSAMDLLSFDTGSANPTLNRNLIHPVIVPWPPVEEQSRIAAFLDCETAGIDRMVEKVRGAIERLREYRSALISAAVTGKIDVREAI